MSGNQSNRGYIFELTKKEFDGLRWKIYTANYPKTNVLPKDTKNQPVENLHRFNNLKHSTVNPKAFTEKGLYMLATILKSQRATQTTLAIIETFAKIKNLSRNIKELSTVTDERKKKNIMRKSGEIITEIFDDDLSLNETETTIELNFAVLKFKHTIKRK
ncbi:MAG: ORF6N domain-containing protein [Bacteroidia bacterium]|nr:ORF6N domain-containing protein [Bacteroidia bacterium]